jgi:Skp family chaperone for outer membrane proteins
MKNLTKISVLALGLAAVSVPAFAKPVDHHRHGGKRAHARELLAERHAKLRAHIAKRIELSDEQKAQLKAKRDELKSSLKALKDDASLTKEQKREKAQALMKSARGNFRSVLNADQQKKLETLREKMRARAPKHGKRVL